MNEGLTLLIAIPSLRKMELSLVIWIIVLGSRYIAFPVEKVFLSILKI